MRTKHHVILYIAFWDYTKFPKEIQQNIWVAGTQVVVKVCDEAYCNSFDFPFFHDKEDNNLFFDYDPEAKGEWYKERNVTDTEIKTLLNHLEILAMECSDFFKKKAKGYLDKNFRDDIKAT